jgi:signal transduction histidine kinase
MTAASAPGSPPPANPDPRHRARERLYVVCQSAAWLFLLAVQSVFVLVLPQKDTPRDVAVTNLAIVAYTIMLGWLITHFTRPLLTRWGWKDLGWRALAPRIFATAAVQSAVWTLLGFAYPYGVLQLPWSSKASLPAVLAVSWINGLVMLAGWLCVYFFYHLFDRFNRLQIEQLQLAAHAKESELRALKSQINPHFIFNALNSLRALIDEEPARARQAVTQLANLLRYSLQSAQAETVAFEDELRVVHDYLALEQVRHEERLRVRLDIDPATLGLAVPPLLLQTLVENAVKYGISARPEGGEIAIIARCRDGRLELRVENPGELDADAARAPAGGSTGLGLKNAAERLRLFFGDRAWLRLRAEAGERVVAEVSIPAPVSAR